MPIEWVSPDLERVVFRGDPIEELADGFGAHRTRGTKMDLRKDQYGGRRVDTSSSAISAIIGG